MIKIFKTVKDQLKEIKKFEKGCWVNLSNPTNEETEKISRRLKIPMDFLTDPLDVDERARIEVEKKCVLIVLRIPCFEGKNVDIPFTTLPLGIIFVEDLIITICSRDVEIVSDFINGKTKNLSTENRSRFILQIFLRTALLYLKHLKEINRRTTTTEKELHQAMKNEELINLLNIEKSLVFFITSLKSNELMMERLQKSKFVKLDINDQELLEDVIIENRQAIEMTNVYSNILSGMMDAFASVISNNLSVVVKILTSITIILMLPTLVASIYGMNIKLPFQNNPHSFLITIGISFVLSAIGVIFFIRRKWF
jgi:magnesium transporter